MGAANVKAVYAHWKHLPDPAFRLLVFMALTTRDDDAEPSFWGGQDMLVVGIGRGPGFPDDDAEKAAYRAVGRAMQKLRSAGAIVRTVHSAPGGQSARHRLVLDPSPDVARLVTPAPDTGRAASGEHTTHRGGITGRATSEHRTPGDRTPDAPRPAEEEQEPVGLTKDEEISSSTQVGTAREPAAPRWAARSAAIVERAERRSAAGE